MENEAFIDAPKDVIERSKAVSKGNNAAKPTKELTNVNTIDTPIVRFGWGVTINNRASGDHSDVIPSTVSWRRR